MTVEQIKDKYAGRIMECMNEVAEVLREAGYEVTDPEFMDGDDYWWTMIVRRGDGEDDVDISFKIAESEQYDGEENGINFSLDVVEYGGRILGGMTPYNYTEKCWVNRNDEDEVEERFCLMEDGIDGEDILSSLAR